MDKSAENFKKAAAGIGELLKSRNVGTALLWGAGVVLGEKFIEMVVDIVSRQYNIYKSREYFEEMVRAHPQLKQFKPEDVAKYFSSLNHFAPSMAKDPLASGAYITQSLKKLSDEELGGPPPDTFSTLTDIEKKLSDSRGGGKKPATAYSKIIENAAVLGFK